MLQAYVISSALCDKYPIIFSLTIGYLCRQSDQAVLPVTSSDFKLYQHGENQILPKDYGFVFIAGKKYYKLFVTLVIIYVLNVQM